MTTAILRPDNQSAAKYFNLTGELSSTANFLIPVNVTYKVYYTLASAGSSSTSSPDIFSAGIGYGPNQNVYGQSPRTFIYTRVPNGTSATGVCFVRADSYYKYFNLQRANGGSNALISYTLSFERVDL